MSKEKLFCGWGRTDITPPGKMALRGQHHQRLTDVVNDPLYATAMVLQGGDGRSLCWVSMDLVVIDEDATNAIAEALAKELPGFTRGQLICSVIHTHTGPFLRSDYVAEFWGETFRQPTPEGCITPEHYRDEIFIPKVVEACLEAYQNLAPAGYSAVLGHAAVGHCRRVHYRHGASVMYGNTNDYNFDTLECPTDHGVEMLYLYDASRRLTGLVLNVNCPAQVLEMNEFYSADYIGAFRKMVAEKLGHPLPVLALIGTAGNIAPRDLVRAGRGEPDMWSQEGADELARRLLHCFEYGLPKADEKIAFEAVFSHRFERLPLLLRTVTAEEAKEAQIQYDRLLLQYGGDPYRMALENRAGASEHAGIIHRWKRQQSSTHYDAPVHIVRLGDCAFVTQPVETYIEYGLRMRARIPAEHVFTAELTDNSAGYLPTPVAVKAKSYSATAAGCLISCEGGEVLTECTIRMARELFKEEN